MKREELIWGSELKPLYPPRKRKVEGGAKKKFLVTKNFFLLQEEYSTNKKPAHLHS